jgi:Ca2+-binding EF-hand superfamily protein
LDDLKHVVHHLNENLTDEEIQNIFEKADHDEDGFVTVDDFYNIMTPKSLWD